MGRVAVDLFAGGGGASEGIRRAFGVAPIVAVNHDPHAIAMHAANHPSTIHLQESVFAVDPRSTVTGPVDLLWASPDCKHFSRAKGGVPRDKRIRALAWVVVDWAAAIRPTVIGLENVAEFTTWGPLDEDGHPIKARAGETFRQFVGALESLGYAVEWRQLVAADYGAPTTRTRFFLVARCDGMPIVWPDPSHGKDRAQPWRTAAECIDWSIPMPSIFLTRAEAKAWARANRVGCPQRPLADKTQRRIAEGLRRFVIESPKPYIVCVTHGEKGASVRRSEPTDEPLRTTTAANGGERALLRPTLLRVDHTSDGHLRGIGDVDEPLRTVTSAGGHALAAAHLVDTRNSEREGQRPRARDVERPLGVVTATGSQGALVQAWLAKHYGGVVGHSLDRAIGSITARDHHALAAVHIGKMYGTSHGQGADVPLHTITGGGAKFAAVAAFFVKFYGSGGQWASLSEPMHTIVTKARMGLVTVDIGGQEYAIADIGMRMLAPRELARANGFHDSYVLNGTKEQQIARIGNSVPPDVVEALCRANFPDDVQTEAA